jgi:DNA-binding transcriptional ArsR family regulator
VVDSSDELSVVFQALADPTRRAIISRLRAGSSTVGELAEPFAISLPAISRHLKILEDAALISNERQGKHRRCHLEREALAGVAEWIDFQRTFWNRSFDRLDARLKQTKGTRKP